MVSFGPVHCQAQSDAVAISFARLQDAFAGIIGQGAVTTLHSWVQKPPGWALAAFTHSRPAAHIAPLQG